MKAISSARWPCLRANLEPPMSSQETEVLEIGHSAMKLLFDTNPDLVESLSFIISERREGLVPS
jgi:hypothetical protein